VGDKISFYYEDKKLNEQPIDPDVNLHIWFDALFTTCKIKSVKLTAEKLSDDTKTVFKAAAPTQEIFVGSGVHPKPEYGKACRYRIPALATSKKGTILAFCEARRVGGADIGDNDAVVKRSEDNGKTWGPEIVIWDAGGHSINNPSATVDPKTGRIWVWMGRWDGNAPTQHVAYSDDDGKTWSKAKDMSQILREQITDGRRLIIPGPGSGITLTRGKYAGRLVIPMNHGDAWGPSVVYSDDSGETWKVGGALHQNIGESKCAELIDGSVLYVGNPGRGTKRRLTIITEGGTKNATEMWEAEDIKHAGCQGAVERHSWPKDGKPGILLYSGPGLEGARARGTLHGSYDEGKTWPWKFVYYQGGSGYSDIEVLADGRVAILFEKDGKSKLGFMVVPAPPAEPPRE
jgi:sialidase-1